VDDTATAGYHSNKNATFVRTLSQVADLELAVDGDAYALHLTAISGKLGNEFNCECHTVEHDSRFTKNASVSSVSVASPRSAVRAAAVPHRVPRGRRGQAARCPRRRDERLSGLCWLPHAGQFSFLLLLFLLVGWLVGWRTDGLFRGNC